MSIIVEIHAAEGGEDARLFVREQFAIYAKYAVRKSLTVAILDDRAGQIAFEVSGEGAALAFAHEPGGHRVQRVPPTEKRGRVHSSSVTVAVLPVPEDRELVIPERELEWKVCRGGGPGGQGVNTTDSAVQLTHLPTRTMVRCESERSQRQNRQSALSILRSKLAAATQAASQGTRDAERQRQLGSGQRGDKVRTVAFQRGEVVDHRLGTRMRIREYMDGRLEELLP